VARGWTVLHSEGDQFKESEMSGACSMHGRDRKCAQNFWLENLKGRDHSAEAVVGGRIILEWIVGK
jgi:hypothetical protein